MFTVHGNTVLVVCVRLSVEWHDSTDPLPPLQLSELSDQLSGGESLRSLSVPLDDYSSMLEQVNTTRRTLGMSPLDVCDAYTRLAQVHVRQRCDANYCPDV